MFGRSGPSPALGVDRLSGYPAPVRVVRHLQFVEVIVAFAHDPDPAMGVGSMSRSWSTSAMNRLSGCDVAADVVLRLRGVDGRELRAGRIPAGTLRTELDLGGLPAAVYVVELTVEGRTLTQRLVVQ